MGSLGDGRDGADRRRLTPARDRAPTTLPRGALTGAACLLAVAVGARRLVRVEVSGHSMAPQLLPGDRVVALRGLPTRPGDVVAAVDPRGGSRLLVKRVAAVQPDGALVLVGDNPVASTDSRTFGPVPARLVTGRVVWRYLPRNRRGPVGGRRYRVR